MVVFMRHTALLSSIGLDIDDVSDMVGDEVGGELDLPML